MGYEPVIGQRYWLVGAEDAARVRVLAVETNHVLVAHLGGPLQYGTARTAWVPRVRWSDGAARPLGAQPPVALGPPSDDPVPLSALVAHHADYRVAHMTDGWSLFESEMPGAWGWITPDGDCRAPCSGMLPLLTRVSEALVPPGA